MEILLFRVFVNSYGILNPIFKKGFLLPWDNFPVGETKNACFALIYCNLWCC